MIIYLDESGQTTGFGKQGSSRTFNIAMIVCNESDGIRRVIKAFEKSLIRHGWPKDIEIKASSLFDARRNPRIPTSFKYKHDAVTPLTSILTKLSSCQIEVDYISVKKERLTENLKTAPFGIIYNYLAGEVLKYRLANSIQVRLIVDAQNTEVHVGKHFNGYIETVAFQVNETLRRFNIQHLESHKVAGLRAVDYFSWSVFRKFEFGDSRFYDLFENSLNRGNCQEWFYQ